jgi:hypothetical protein
MYALLPLHFSMKLEEAQPSQICASVRKKISKNRSASWSHASSSCAKAKGLAVTDSVEAYKSQQQTRPCDQCVLFAQDPSTLASCLIRVVQSPGQSKAPACMMARLKIEYSKDAMFDNRGAQTNELHKERIQGGATNFTFNWKKAVTP